MNLDSAIQLYRKRYLAYVKQASMNNGVKEILQNAEKTERDFPFYICYPRLFSDSFLVEDTDELSLLCIAGYLYYNSLISLDQAFDSTKKSISVDSFLIASTCQEEGIKLLGHLFHPNSLFWRHWQRHKSEYFAAIETERRHKISNSIEYYKLADYKSAFGKVAIDSLFIITQGKHKNEYKKLIAAHRYFSIANQLVDDVQDLIQDIKNNQYNWVYSQLHQYLEGRNIRTDNMSYEQIKKNLYSSRLALDIYRCAGRFYSKEIETSKETGAILWIDTINDVKQKNDQRISALRGFYKIIETKRKLYKKKYDEPVSEKQPQKSYLSPFEKGLEYLLEQIRIGLPEIKHIMYLGKSEDFQNRSQIHIGDVFQRAIVCDILYDIQSYSNYDFSGIIRQELSYLKRKRNRDTIGGWSYFSSLKEIAADIDDFGQILQLLSKTKQTSFVKKNCLPVIDFIHSNCLSNTGGIKTWILPVKPDLEIDRLRLHFNQTKWGEGPDAEVVANYIYSLILLNKEKYISIINNACAYIKSKFNNNGFWESRWYYGNYYGTYVCTRALCSLNNDSFISDISEQIVHSLVESQNQDGGWGVMRGNSDPLNTSFAIFTLKLLKNDYYNHKIEQGKEYLISSQNENYSWPGINFIRPRFDEPYRSSTVTTAYVLKALKA